MKVCTFFGHRDCPTSIKPHLRSVLIDLIDNHDIDTFYLGNQGNFDRLAYTVLHELSQKYSNIKYTIVFAYLPSSPSLFSATNTLLPEGIENIPPRFAVVRRNNWMLDKADLVVSYVDYSYGGAAKFTDIARQKKKIVINLAEQI